MARSVRFIQAIALVFIGGISAGLLVGLTAMEHGDRRPNGDDELMAIYGFVGSGVSVLLSLYFHFYARRERRLLTHGQETVGEALRDPRGVRFMAGSEAIFVQGVPYDLGAVTGRGPMLYDPRNPKRMTALRLEMLPPETLRELLPRPVPALLPPVPRPPNREWIRLHRPRAWCRALWISILYLIGLAGFSLVPGLKEQWTCAVAFGFPLLFVVPLSAVMVLRSRGRSDALWREGLETRARATHIGATSVTFQFAAGEILAKGNRSFAAGAAPWIDGGGAVVVLVDPLDPENRTAVMRREAAQPSG